MWLSSICISIKRPGLILQKNGVRLGKKRKRKKLKIDYKPV